MKKYVFDEKGNIIIVENMGNFTSLINFYFNPLEVTEYTLVEHPEDILVDILFKNTQYLN